MLSGARGGGRLAILTRRDSSRETNEKKRRELGNLVTAENKSLIVAAI